jgi:protein involved in polysaccharide export with SLBB domain
MRQTIVLLILISNCVFSQGIANYFERKLFLNDSIIVDVPSVIASEGVIEPEDYLVGPGDVLFISIRGIEEFVFKPAVNFEGSIYIPKIGGIDLSNLTLLDAKKKITQEIFKNYKNVQIYISLSEIRKIKVGLFGDIKKPNTHNLFGNSRLSDLISRSQGLNPTSDLRNIRITRRDGTIHYCDFLSYIRLGNKNHNPYLLDGDHVFIDKIDKVVGINGNVKFPGTYEFKESETVSDLITLAGGLLYNAKQDSIELIRFGNDNKTQNSKFYSYDFLKNNEIILENKDLILVRVISEYLIDNLVYVNGYVKYPGYYKIEENNTYLSEIINNSGGFLQNGSLTEATVIRNYGTIEKDPEFDRIKLMKREEMTDDEYDYFKSRSRQRIGRVVVDFIELFEKNNSKEDVILKRGDYIDVPEKKNYITIIGQVVNPGNIPFKAGLKVNDYILLAGGFGWRALEDEVRVIMANTGEWVDFEDVYELKPGDTIWIPEDPPTPRFWVVFKDILSVVGQLATVIAATIAVIVSTR